MELIDNYQFITGTPILPIRIGGLQVHNLGKVQCMQVIIILIYLCTVPWVDCL